MDLKSTYEDPDIHQSWESVYRSNPNQDRFNDRIMDRLIALIAPPPEALFLDAGCGIGDHTFRIVHRGYRCIGVDISEHILQMAAHKAAELGFQERVSFACEKLERLSYPDSTFDSIHCRGVLMHIPDWEQALQELCRVLKPGGRIAILESNQAALEYALVQLVRAVTRRKSRAVQTAGGLEFWFDRDDHPFVVRATNIQYLIYALEARRCRLVRRVATEFWDINRFPAGMFRTGIIQFNRLWFALRLPTGLSVGNAVVAEKLRT